MRKIPAPERVQKLEAKLPTEEADLKNDNMHAGPTVAEFYGCICHRPLKHYPIDGDPAMERRRRRDNLEPT